MLSKFRWKRLYIIGAALAVLSFLLWSGSQLVAQAYGGQRSVRGGHYQERGTQTPRNEHHQGNDSDSVRIWVQTMDSCKQAIPGSNFVLTGNGLNVMKGPAPGDGPVTVSNMPSGCPLERGDCARVPTGCLYWDVPISASGSKTYQIKETKSPANYMACTGGSVCPGGPVVITLSVNEQGAVAATAFNIYPDRQTVTWPTSGPAYTGTQRDPIVVHNFELGDGSCDGDNDADDHLTGSPSMHCDSDGDRFR